MIFELYPDSIQIVSGLYPNCIRIESWWYPGDEGGILALECFFLHSLSLCWLQIWPQKNSEMKLTSFFLSLFPCIISWTFGAVSQTSGHFEYIFSSILLLASWIEMYHFVAIFSKLYSIGNYRDRRDFSLNFEIVILICFITIF